ncbi:hypothetical protein TrVGV298_007073 [Trichoderma virens]|nr:hypothetical protein TrVGV298_007073 [Trichoderma virens]
MPVVRDISELSLDMFTLLFGARLAEALVAVISVGLVTLVYTLLIQRGSLIATTYLYPRRPIKVNISRLINEAWLLSSEEASTLWKPKMPARNGRSNGIIQLFYIGKMEGDPRYVDIWMPLTRNVVQIIVWEWIFLWLIILMVVSILLFNGFFTNEPGYIIWVVSLVFFKLVFAGASWSLLERSKFVIGKTHNLQSHSVGASFKFRSIDKANEAYVPTTFSAKLGSPTTGSPTLLPSSPTSSSAEVAQEQDTEPVENAEPKVALEILPSFSRQTFKSSSKI